MIDTSDSNAKTFVMTSVLKIFLKRDFYPWFIVDFVETLSRC